MSPVYPLVPTPVDNGIITVKGRVPVPVQKAERGSALTEWLDLV